MHPSKEKVMKPPQGEFDPEPREHIRVNPDGTKEIVSSRRQLRPRGNSRWQRLKLGGKK